MTHIVSKHFISKHFLNKKRTTYNNNYINIFKKQGFAAQKLQQELDRLWIDIYSKSFIKYSPLMMINGPQMAKMEAWELYKIAALNFALKKCNQQGE